MLESDPAIRIVHKPRSSRKELPATQEPHQRSQFPINDAVRPCLLGLVRLSARDRKVPPDVVYEHARKLLSELKRRLGNLSISRDDVEDIHYALVAFADEAMQQHSTRLAEFWSAHLLQLEFYGETRAGEGFFERLRRIKADGREGVLRVYQLCLLFGFHGVYGQHGELERENLLQEVRAALGEGDDPAVVTLSPHGARPDEPAFDRVRNQLLMWLAVAIALCSVAWYIGIAFTLDQRARALRDAVQRADEDLKVGIVADSE